jgi:hypothetical protein
LAQDRDRFAREPAYHYLLRREFEEYGTKIRALNDRGDDSPEGELTDGILDQLAKFERAKTAERSRRGKLRKAREGKIVATTYTNYGFEYTKRRDAYAVREVHMSTVRRVFSMVALEGASLYRVKRVLELDRITPPKGGRYWNKKTLQEMILDDVYKPHTPAEIGGLVNEGLMSREVAAGLDPELCYGVWWYNRRRTIRTRAKRADGAYYWKQNVRERPGRIGSRSRTPVYHANTWMPRAKPSSTTRPTPPLPATGIGSSRACSRAACADAGCPRRGGSRAVVTRASITTTSAPRALTRARTPVRR